MPLLPLLKFSNILLLLLNNYYYLIRDFKSHTGTQNLLLTVCCDVASSTAGLHQAWHLIDFPGQDIGEEAGSLGPTRVTAGSAVLPSC